MPFSICRIGIMSRLISDPKNCADFAVLFCHFIGKTGNFPQFCLFVCFFADRFQAEMAPIITCDFPQCTCSLAFFRSLFSKLWAGS